MYRLKKLIEVKFHTTAGEKLNGQKIDEKLCPSCTKTLNNGIKCIRTCFFVTWREGRNALTCNVIVLRTCGHVFCKSCSDQFVKPSLKCQSCEETCKEQDLILLSGGEGTGYVSGGGKVQAEKTMEAFQ